MYDQGCGECGRIELMEAEIKRLREAKTIEVLYLGIQMDALEAEIAQMRTALETIRVFILNHIHDDIDAGIALAVIDDAISPQGDTSSKQARSSL